MVEAGEERLGSALAVLHPKDGADQGAPTVLLQLLEKRVELGPGFRMAGRGEDRADQGKVPPEEFGLSSIAAGIAALFARRLVLLQQRRGIGEAAQHRAHDQRVFPIEPVAECVLVPLAVDDAAQRADQVLPAVLGHPLQHFPQRRPQRRVGRRRGRGRHQRPMGAQHLPRERGRGESGPLAPPLVARDLRITFAVGDVGEDAMGLPDLRCRGIQVTLDGERSLAEGSGPRRTNSAHG